MIVKRRRTIIIRSGGLGDFILTLPILRALNERGDDVVLVTRPEYSGLIEHDQLFQHTLSIDAPIVTSLLHTPSVECSELFADAHVLSFLPDHDGRLEATIHQLGARDYVAMPHRPVHRPHIVCQMASAAGIQLPNGALWQSTLQRPGNYEPTALWLHPGSGSTTKNAPMSWFVAQARRWAATNRGPVIVSFGDADQPLRPVAKTALSGLDWHAVDCPTLKSLRYNLATKAAMFIGNDSGVSHLAAALAVPVRVKFSCTNPEIWRPVGRNVEVTDG